MSQYLSVPRRDPFAEWGWTSEPMQVTYDVQFQTCPECGHRADVDDCDVSLADDGNVFCPRCWAEIPIVPEWCEVPVSDEAAAMLAELAQDEPAVQRSLFTDDGATP